MLAIALVACPASDEGSDIADRVPPTLRDTTGAQFEVLNGDLDDLRPDAEVELPPACDGEQPMEFEFWLGETGLSMICVLHPDTGGPIDVLCRPIACDSTIECTPGFSCVGGMCRCTRGLCISTSGNGRVEDDELVALCLADHARTSTCPIGLEDAWVFGPVSTSCDEETNLCSIPAECR